MKLEKMDWHNVHDTKTSYYLAGKGTAIGDHANGCYRKNFKRRVIIIDCFEVFCERPSNLKTRSQLWSNYKHHNTVKFLIGISPQGVVSFITEGWGGCVSDVQLTEGCGLLRRLLPGDVVLADRGFTIQESVGMFCAEVKTPPFTRGKKQLSKFEVDTARQLSRVRIHVEGWLVLLDRSIQYWSLHYLLIWSCATRKRISAS